MEKLQELEEWLKEEINKNKNTDVRTLLQLSIGYLTNTKIPFVKVMKVITTLQIMYNLKYDKYQL